MVEPSSAPVGLRERKKRQTRQILLDTAERMFEEHGYDHVTVAEIADASNISVKTLFTYFASKEDLAFGDESQLRDALTQAIASRGPGVSVFAAAAAELQRQAKQQDTTEIDGIERWHRSVGASLALQSRLRRMWSDYEDAVAEVIVQTTPKIDPPLARLQAMQVIAMVRSLTSPEVRALVSTKANPRRALSQWIDRAAKQLA